MHSIKALSGLLLFSFILSCNKAPENKNTDITNLENFRAQESGAQKTYTEIANLNEALVQVENKVQEQINTKTKNTKSKKIVQKKRRVVVSKKNPVIKVEDKVQVKKAAVNKTQTTLAKKEEPPQTKKFSSTLDMMFNTNSQPTDSEDKSYSIGTWIFLRYKLSSEYTARVWMDIQKDMAQSYETRVQDTRLTLAKKGFEIADKLTLTPSVTAVLPTSEQSKRNEEMIFGVELNSSFTYKATETTTLTYLPRFVRNFHEYETTRTNAVNVEHRILQFFVLNQSITEKFYGETALIYVNDWSYQGTRRDPSYLTQLELGYRYDKDLTFATGTLTGGSIFDTQNGPDKRLEVYDRDLSSYYAKFILNI